MGNCFGMGFFLGVCVCVCERERERERGEGRVGAKTCVHLHRS